VLGPQVMGQTITSAADMISYAGELRRTAKRAPAPELAQKMQQSANQLEKTAINQVTKAAGPRLGALLDKLV
jgi:hypothetical protein